ncbi:MAG: radical SAM protein [Candidatus Bathyarchaeia archaeon]
MDLRRLELALTTRCNSQCVYCQADAGPWRNEVMDVRDAHNYLTEAVKVADLKSFMVFGGEPMLYPTAAIAIFKKAQQLKIPSIDMLTNGIWGRDKETAERLAKKLKNAGLNTLGISVDAFHLEHIPLEYPRNAAQASLKATIEKVTWNVAVIESLDAANHYDKMTAHILKELEPVGIEAHVHKVAAAGRALQTIPQYFQKTRLDGPCEGETPMENTLTNPQCLTIEPSGSMDICWHLSIGNAIETPLSLIISKYDWQGNPMIKTLVEEGPMGLLERQKPFADRFNKSECVNKCHLCVEVRKAFNLT